MASLPIEASSREALMTQELSMFWLSMSRKFEYDRPHHRAFNPVRSTSEATWDNLVAHDKQSVSVVPTTSYLKEDEEALSDGQTMLTPSPYEGGNLQSDNSCQLRNGVDLLDCEFRSRNHQGDSCWVVSEDEQETGRDEKKKKKEEELLEAQKVVDGGAIGDVPASYLIKGLRSHEVPVIGTYVDPSVVTGFTYAVRPADSRKFLFQGRALRLVSIGMGYGKRLTFASETHNENPNYFWSDTHPQGYGFAIKLVQENDKFTLRDANDTPLATAQVVKLVGSQKEVSHRVLEDGSVEKQARVSLVCKIHYFHLSHADQKPLLISGVAVSIKPSGSRSTASLQKIIKCSIGGERGYTLVAGADTSSHITMVNGEKNGDIPIQYSITGLQPHEVPVIGTYVDPSILTGFRYRVRPVNCKKPMFGGAALNLQSIGRGYGKRLTFSSNNLNNNENYFWSDTNPQGYGFSIQAVSPGHSFRIMSSSGEDLGRAQVFRADAPQVEESTDISHEGRVTKRVRVTVTCDVSFHNEDDQTLIVTGTAVLVRKGRLSQLQKLEDVAVGSQINLIFRHAKETLTFITE